MTTRPNLTFNRMKFLFLRTILLITLLFGIVLVYPIYGWATPEVFEGIIAAGIVALANVLIGYLMMEYALDKPNQQFLSLVFGGMAIRLLATMVVLFILFTAKYHQLALSLSLMVFYVVYMVAEIIYITRVMSRRKVPAHNRRKQRSNNPSSFSRSIAIESAKK